MTYAVVYGADRTIRRPQTATECLGLVKMLHGRAIADIEIFDESGAVMRLADLERRHQKEVESKYLLESANDKRALPVGPAVRSGERSPRIERTPSPGWFASFLFVTVTFPIAAAIAFRLLRERFAHKDMP